MRRALVTGAAGFVGRWLCRELVADGWHVTGTSLELPDETDRVGPLAAVHWRRADVRRADELADALDAAVPNAIFHLAGIAYLPAAQGDPGHALELNVVATARLLSLLRERRASGTLDPVVLIVGSAEQYGRHEPDAMPLTESAEQRPLSVYGASKCAQEVVAMEVQRSTGLRVIATRSFNHSGPGQSEQFLLPALVRRARALRESRGTELPVGNLTPVRDYLHVRDVARAYLTLAEQSAPGEVYNVASGLGVTVESVARRVLALMGVDAILKPDPALVRPADIPVLVGDASKLRATTGWSPQHSLDSILDDLIRATPH